MDLSLVSIDDLIAEIGKRTDSAVILGHKETSQGDVYNYHEVGNRMCILGMLEISIEKIKKDCTANETGGFNND